MRRANRGLDRSAGLAASGRIGAAIPRGLTAILPIQREVESATPAPVHDAFERDAKLALERGSRTRPAELRRGHFRRASTPTCWSVSTRPSRHGLYLSVLDERDELW